MLYHKFICNSNNYVINTILYIYIINGSAVCIEPYNLRAMQMIIPVKLVMLYLVRFNYTCELMCYYQWFGCYCNVI